MKKLLRNSVFLFVAISIVWWYVNRERIRHPGDFLRLAGQQISSFGVGELSQNPGQEDTARTIRVASFNVQVFGTRKAGKPEVIAALSEIVRQFDLVALQEIRTQEPSLIPAFVQSVNSTGRDYAYSIGPRTGRNTHKEQYVFIYDRQTISLDASQTYRIEDPDDLMRREPFVGWFRTRNAPMDRAFTFSLANVHLDSSTPEAEVQHLDQVFRAIRNDGRGEDDVIIIGDFNVDNRKLQNLAYRHGLHGVISAMTNTRGNRQYDNIILAPIATTEFTGRSGVLNFIDHFQLTLDDALQISDHLPVWAEFSVFEGGRDDQLADSRSKSTATSASR